MGTTNLMAKDPIKYVFQQGLLFRIDSRCWWGRSSKMKEDELGNVDPEVIKGIKVLVDPNRLAPIRSYKSFGDRVIKKYGYPFLGLRGVYFVPRAMVENCDNTLKETQVEYFKLVDEFVDNIDDYKKEWQVKSKEHYDENLYPEKPALRDRFGFSWIKFVIDLPDPETSILNEAAYKEELEKQRAKMKEFLDETLAMLASKFISILDNIEKKLKSGDKIKPKTLESLQSFVETFEAMNVTNNAKLRQLVEKASKVMGSTGAKEFNSDDKLRDKVAKQVESVVSSFKTTAEKDTRFKRALEF